MDTDVAALPWPVRRCQSSLERSSAPDICNKQRTPQISTDQLSAEMEYVVLSL